MNIDLFPSNYRTLITNGKASPIMLSNENSSAIPDASSGLIFEITNNVGSDILICSLLFCFDVTYSKLSIEVKNTQQNRMLISGNTQLGNLGVANTTKSMLGGELEIVPFILSSGQFIQIFASNTLGVSVPAKSICLTVKGMQ
jgi:hypothetical protein